MIDIFTKHVLQCITTSIHTGISYVFDFFRCRIGTYIKNRKKNSQKRKRKLVQVGYRTIIIHITIAAMLYID